MILKAFFPTRKNVTEKVMLHYSPVQKNIPISDTNSHTTKNFWVEIPPTQKFTYGFS